MKTKIIGNIPYKGYKIQKILDKGLVRYRVNSRNTFSNKKLSHDFDYLPNAKNKINLKIMLNEHHKKIHKIHKNGN